MNGHNNTPADDTDELDYSEEWLTAYVDDELSTAQRAIVEQRVAVDGEAAAMLRDLQQIRSLVGNLPAWSGELKPTLFDDFHEVLQLPGARTTDDVALLAESGVSLAPAEVAAQESRLAATRGPSPSARKRGPSPADSAWRLWQRPLAVAAGVLLVLGLGWMLWPPTADIRSVATSSRLEEPEALAAEQAPETQAKSAAADVEPSALDLQMAEAAGNTLDADHARSAQRRAASPPPGAASSSAESQLAGGGGGGGYGGGMGARGGYAPPEAVERAAPAAAAALPAPRPAAQPTSPVPMAATESSATMAGATPTPANPAPQLALQLAYSDAWTPEKILAGLGRVSALLRRPLAMGGELTKSSSVDTVDTVAPSSGTAAQDFPVVIATQAQGVQPLVAGLRQLGLPLQGPAADARLADAQSLAPLMEAAGATDSTVALFVSFEQAERVLELARRSELIVGDPAWISSAAMAAEPLAAQQPVVMLFTPQ